MGGNEALGDHAYCDEPVTDATYAGKETELCGGRYNWGKTGMEVWRLAN